MPSFFLEEISKDNVYNLAQLFVALWSECDLDEELEYCKEILNLANETCFLIKEKEKYVAFVHVALRIDYVEGLAGITKTQSRIQIIYLALSNSTKCGYLFLSKKCYSAKQSSNY